MSLGLQASTDRNQEMFQVGQEILLSHTSLPVEQNEQLTLHQIHLRQREAKPIVPLHYSVPSPVYVVGARVIQTLSRENKRGQEDSVASTTLALNSWGGDEHVDGLGRRGSSLGSAPGPATV